MNLSRITLCQNALTPERMIQLMEAGEYAIHQWLWELFPGLERRNFLYRQESRQGQLCFYLLSERSPEQQHPFFDVETKPFMPLLRAGQRLGFALRVNPVICRSGKRHDLLMETKRRLKESVDPREMWEHQAEAARKWLERQGEHSGFQLVQAEVDNYRQHRLTRLADSRPVQFSSVDYQGTLIVNEPERFLARIVAGWGKSRAFGCGLMLIRPAVE
jgi:CRISPR system Cascade subunit CasE